VFGEDFKAHVLSGESKLSKQDVLMLARNLGENDEILYSAAELWAFGKTGTFQKAVLLAQILPECGPETHSLLWQESEAAELIRESIPQLKHLLTMPDDETAAALVRGVLDGSAPSTIKMHEVRKKERVAARLEEIRRQGEDATARAGELPPEKFRVIEADPPWALRSQEKKSQHYQYPTMGLEEIKALGGRVVAVAEDDAHLYLWAINPMLEEAFEVVRAWGFEFKTLITWRKSDGFGTGHYFRGQTEHVLFCVRGSLGTLSNDLPNVFDAKRTGRHSGKPDEFYDLVDKASPGPRLRLFARSQREGWFSWGDQASPGLEGDVA
jgi:N6-adenosine-specific RNA methylase IME4